MSSSKGRGFSGTIKKYSFSTQRKTHGQGDTYRHVGSIGNASDPSRVFPGKKMPGRYGNKTVSVKSLEVIKIDELKNQTQSMGILASQMLKDSVMALENFDMSLADDVREGRHELAKMDHDIEDKVLRTIALNQPRASDMRLLGTILKIITYQNRIGRYGKDIASIAIGMDEKKHLAKLVKIPKMTKNRCGVHFDSNRSEIFASVN